MLHTCDTTKMLLHFLTFWDLNSAALALHCEGAKLYKCRHWCCVRSKSSMTQAGTSWGEQWFIVIRHRKHLSSDSSIESALALISIILFGGSGPIHLRKVSKSCPFMSRKGKYLIFVVPQDHNMNILSCRLAMASSMQKPLCMLLMGGRFWQNHNLFLGYRILFLEEFWNGAQDIRGENLNYC